MSLLATDHSYLAAQGLSPDLIKGVIAVSTGLFDMTGFTSPAIPGYPFTDIFGDVEQMWNASPLKYVDGTQPPFLIMYGSNDNPGFAEDNTAFYHALVAAGSEAELHMIPGRNHQMIIGNAAQPGDPAREYILQFIRDHIGTASDAGPFAVPAVAGFEMPNVGTGRHETGPFPPSASGVTTPD